MRIVDRFSFSDAEGLFKANHPLELAEVETAIGAIDGESCRIKLSRERGREGDLLYSPIAINYCLLQKQLYLRGWDTSERKRKISRHFPATGENRSIPMSMDGIKNGVGLESQLAKYAFLEYDVLAKMPIYQRLGLIAIGIEIVQVSRLRRLMSSGVGDFERLATNLVTRGERSDDFPVLVLGIDVDPLGTALPNSVVYEGEAGSRLQGGRPGPG